MRPRDRVIALAALAGVAVAIFDVGGVLRSSQAAVAVLIAIAIGTTAMSQRSFARRSPLIVLLAVAAGLTLLQLIPLPEGLVEHLAPTTTALREDGTDLLGVSRWHSITADRGATLSSFVQLATLLGLAMVASRISAAERGRYRIVAAIGALCSLASLVSLLHELLGLRALYGIYEPEHAAPRVLGPLLNTNSLGCLAAIGALLCVGLAAHRRQPAWLRALWLALTVPNGAVTVASVSRGATIALLAGAFVTIAVLVAQRFASNERSRRRKLRFVASALPLGVLAGCLVILLIYSNAGNVERQLSQISFNEVHQSRSKYVAWRSAAQLVEESPWLGVGRGSFEAVFTRVHPASGVATYSYLENEYLQAVVDWGIPGALLLGAAALWLALVAARRWKDGSLAAGGLGALVVIALQSNVDFGMEFLGLSAPAVALAATLTYSPLHDAPRLLLRRVLRLVHALVLLVGAGLLLSSVTTTLDEDRIAIAKHPSLARVRASVSRHPLDYYGFAVAADLLDRSGDPHSIRLLNHAMALHPTHPQLHRMAARMLYEEGFVAQSGIEYAAALRTGGDPLALIKEVLARFHDDEGAAAFPTDYPYPDFIIRRISEQGRKALARKWLARVLDSQRPTQQLCDLAYRLVLGGDLEAAPMAGKKCGDRLPDYDTRLALAKILLAHEAPAEAMRLLRDVEGWQTRRDNKIDAWLVLCDAQLALGDRDGAKHCLRALDASPDMLNERRGEIIHRIDAINGRAP